MQLEKFDKITVWKNNGERAPHKPLLILLSLSEFGKNPDRLIPYTEIDTKLNELLEAFGPPRTNYRPSYPFWRMQKDGIWTVNGSERVRITGQGDAYISDLKNNDISGSFPLGIRKELAANPKLIPTIVQNILDANFPATMHQDILQSLGLDLSENDPVKRKRSSDFRQRILQAYEYRCAVCGFDIRLGHAPIGLEAAHIKWHQAGGPDEEINGLALCALHHKLFDRGAFTLSENLEVLVSDKANGSHGFKECLMDFHGRKINYPQRTTYYPEEDFTQWHTREVFKGSYREF